MAPEERGSIALLARLRSEIAGDRGALTRCLRKLEQAEARLQAGTDDVFALEVAAVALHGWYTGLEAISERVARQLDGLAPTGDRWHRDLISQCSTEVPGVRPALLPPELLPDFHALLSFRHFFRHAYGVELDATRVRAEAARLWAIIDGVDHALDAFDAFLGATIKAISPG